VQGHKDGVLINATQKKSALWRSLEGIASHKTPVSQDKKADNGSETALILEAATQRWTEYRRFQHPEHETYHPANALHTDSGRVSAIAFQYPPTPVGICKHLVVSANIFRYQSTPSVIRQHLRIIQVHFCFVWLLH